MINTEAIGANFTLASFKRTTFRGVNFIGCNITRIAYDNSFIAYDNSSTAYDNSFMSHLVPQSGNIDTDKISELMEKL